MNYHAACISINKCLLSASINVSIQTISYYIIHSKLVAAWQRVPYYILSVVSRHKVCLFRLINLALCIFVQLLPDNVTIYETRKFEPICTV